MASITKLKITLDRLHCHLASADVTSEPGSEDEWSMVFTVDGQPHSWHEEHVKTGQDYHLGIVYTVPIDPDHPHKTIQIAASGVEEDWSSADDPLPPAEDTVDPADEWKVGNTYSFSAATSEYAYEIFYKVEVAETAGTGALTAARSAICTFNKLSTSSYCWVGDWDSFVDFWNEKSKDGHRLVSIDTFKVDSDVVAFGDTSKLMYTGTYVDGSDGYALYSGLDSAQLLSKAKTHALQGLQLVDLDGFLQGGTAKFAAVFRAGNGPQQVVLGLSWDQFWLKFVALANAGFRLKCLSTWMHGGKRVWGGAFGPGSGGHTLWVGLHWADLAAKVKTEKAAGRRVIDIASFHEGQHQRYAAYFRDGSTEQEIVHLSNMNDLGKTLEGYLAKGFVATRVIPDRFVE